MSHGLLEAGLRRANTSPGVGLVLPVDVEALVVEPVPLTQIGLRVADMRPWCGVPEMGEELDALSVHLLGNP